MALGVGMLKIGTGSISCARGFGHMERLKLDHGGCSEQANQTRLLWPSRLFWRVPRGLSWVIGNSIFTSDIIVPGFHWLRDVIGNTGIKNPVH